MDDIVKKIIRFRDARDWRKFHTPENLAKSISIEAAELLENFQWDENYSKEKVCEELSDVFIYCILMADSLNINFMEEIDKKIVKNAQKYPIEKAKGNSKKYTEFE